MELSRVLDIDANQTLIRESSHKLRLYVSSTDMVTVTPCHAYHDVDQIEAMRTVIDTLVTASIRGRCADQQKQVFLSIDSFHPKVQVAFIPLMLRVLIEAEKLEVHLYVTSEPTFNRIITMAEQVGLALDTYQVTNGKLGKIDSTTQGKEFFDV